MVVALIDDLQFQQRLEAAAQALGLAVRYPSPSDAPVDFLVAHQPRLIVVDLHARSLDWRAWVLAAKTSPATRKMPILAFGPHVETALWQEARQLGCDAVTSNGSFAADPVGAIQRHARPDESAELHRQAQQPLPALARKAIEQFNRGEYWEQHETFESVWRAEPGPIRQMYQGILQVGVAYYQIQRHNYLGARKMFQRAWQYLNVLPDICQGVDVAQLRADAKAAMDELERLGPERIAEFDLALLKPIHLLDEGRE
ncbi:MAG: DUF309 domain-containing protein [Anaerolineae bacterium]|nr:DUF309 domain-containing protein [Anaerolineae bacterium]